MLGIGTIRDAEFLVAAADLAAFADEGRLTSAAGLVPVPRNSGRRAGNMHRPKRYSRRHLDFYLKRRAQGLKHT